MENIDNYKIVGKFHDFWATVKFKVLPSLIFRKFTVDTVVRYTNYFSSVILNLYVLLKGKTFSSHTHIYI